MDETVDIVVTGHLCVDLVPRTEHIPLERLEVNVRLMATVGDDLPGRLVISFLEAIDPKLTQFISLRPGLRGSYTIVLSPKNADRVLMHDPGPNTQFGVAEVNFSEIAGAKLFHLGYPPILQRLIANDGEELQEIFRRAKGTGVATSLDTSFPDPEGKAGKADWHKILSRCLPFVDIFVPSVEEIIFMLRRTDYEKWQGQVLSNLTVDYLAGLAGELFNMGVVIAGFKLGEYGFYIQAADASLFQRLERLPLDVRKWAGAKVWTPAYQVNVVSAAGAGDSAYAGFLGALLRGMSPMEAARWACAVGACNVEAADATSGVKSWQETQARLDAGWPIRSERIAGI